MNGHHPPLIRAFVLALAGLAFAGASSGTAAVKCSVSSVQLADAYAGQQLLISDGDHDITRAATYASSNPAVAVVGPTGYVTPTGNGSAEIRITHSAGTLAVPITVTGFGSGRPVDFRTEVEPLLSKLGCNAGGCHGKASGQNGFKLSLFGFDTEFDHAAITREGRGRRVFPAAPDQSLFLLKATGQVPHGGGTKLKSDSPEYQVFRRWIAAGTPASALDAPRVARLHVTPLDRVLRPDDMQQLAVIAEYTDGSTRDVTRQSEFASNLDVVATVEPDGFVKAGRQSGEAAIMARHMGHVAVFRALVPHGPPVTDLPEFQPLNYVDELIAVKWKKLGLRPSPVADDGTFLRRVTVDLCGRLPTAAEARGFLADGSPDKRAKAVDRLLDSPDYPAYFAMKWGSILRNSNLAGADRAAYAFHNWIQDMLARNRPYDEFVRGVVAASGEWTDAPAVNWYWQNRDDQLHQTTADVAQVFLGVRLQCAKCHHHPYERWGQADYYGLAGFFTRLGRKSFGEPPPYYASSRVTTGEKNPLTGQPPEPKYPDGPAPTFGPEDDPRHALVDWMAQPDNPFFARALVNRLWGHFLGRGLVHEVDDLRDTNPPSNPELLDAMAKDFVQSKFDMRHMIRIILTSRVYQLSAEPTDANTTDQQNYARYYARRMPAEVFHDAVNQVCGTTAGFNNMGKNARAIDLPHENFGSYFLDAFDRPKRVSVCECERSTGATLAQVLLLSNSDEVENKIADSNGRVARLLKEKTPPSAMVEELFLTGYSRLPTDGERTRTIAYITAAAKGEEARAVEDVLWTILNTREFMFNH